MANKERLRITELDFDGIKSNLKTFLKNQTEFTDYDFEGSGMNVLLDVLAYNTHYQAMNANLMGNEMFLDTAQLRSSVVSHAKLLGYKVRSSRAPKAIVNVEVSATTGITTATIPKGFSFQSSIDNVPYFFITNEAVTKSRENNVLRFEGLEVFEGTLITTRYTVDADNIDFSIVHGSSSHNRMWLGMEETKNTLGFVPKHGNLRKKTNKKTTI